MLSRTFALILCMLILGCQIKEKEPEELIANHAPATNIFSVSSPANGTYTPGNVLNFKLSFPYIMTVTGLPRLKLTIGSTIRYANYVSGNGTKLLTFQYGILAADDDPNGITLNALELNGGTITFTTSLGATDCAVATVTTTNYPTLLIDNGLLLTETACGGLDPSRCRSFSTSALTENLSQNGDLYIAFRTPVGGGAHLLSDVITLIDYGGSYALDTAEGTQVSSLPYGSIEVVKLSFPYSIDLSGLVVGPDVFEVIVVAPDLTPEEEGQISATLTLLYL